MDIYQGVKMSFQKSMMRITGFFVVFFATINVALAQNSEIDDIGANIIETSGELPGLITGLSYMLGVMLAGLGVIKIREHVESPNQTPLRSPVGYFTGGGGLFALPTIYEATQIMINGGNPEVFERTTAGATFVSSLAGAAAGFVPSTFGNILVNMIDSVGTLPGFFTAIAYVLGLLLGAGAVLKLKEHVEDPSRVPLREGVVRLIVGGMLFALPTVMYAVLNAVEDTAILNGPAILNIMLTSTGTTAEGGSCLGRIGGTTLGGIACTIFASSSPMPAFLSAAAYVMGIVVAIWGIMKIKEHVENPQQVQVTDPATKLLVAGGFFALPTVVVAAYNSVVGPVAVPHMNSRGGETRPAGGPDGLDAMLAALMNDAFVPVSALINFFALAVGFLLIFIGISRLMKSTQEGARGPTGIGTIMTFVTGGALLAFSPLIAALSNSIFGLDFQTDATGTIQYTAGINVERAHSVLDAIILFVMLLGMISIARGIFIMRGVAEGNSQASAMAGVTHLVGGAMAVNLGPFLNALQATLGIGQGNLAGLGIIFT